MPSLDGSVNNTKTFPLSGMWDWNVQTDQLQADKGLCEYFSVQPSDGGSGMPISAFIAGIHPDDRTYITERISEAVATGKPFHETYRVQSQTYGTRWIQADGVCFRDRLGRPTNYPGVMIDVTEARNNAPHIEVINRLMEAHEFAKLTDEPLLARLIEAVLLEAGRAHVRYFRKA